MAFYHDIKISFILGIPCRNSNILCFNIEFIFSPRILESQVQFNQHRVYFNEHVLFGGAGIHLHLWRQGQVTTLYPESP